MDNEIIYHYCSMESFFGIITSKNIRLSNAYNTNDDTELEWVFSTLKNSIPSEFGDNLIRLLRTSYKAWLEDYFRPHIACFSINGDLLSQWKSYSNDGKGVSIGFNRSYFEAIKRLDNKEFQISNVVYDSEEQKKILKNFTSAITCEDLKLIESSYIEADNSRFFGEMVLVGALLRYGMQFKNETFFEEKEVRLIHGFDEIAAEPDMFEYRVTDDDLISYIEIPLDIECDYVSIKEIILGPKCKINPKSMRHFLEQNLYEKSVDIEIKKSHSSYR